MGVLVRKFDYQRDYFRVLKFLEDEYKENKSLKCWLPERFDDLIYRIDALYSHTRGLEKSQDYIYIWEDNETIIGLILPDGEVPYLNIKNGYDYLYPEMLSLAERKLRPLYKKNKNGKIEFMVAEYEENLQEKQELEARGYVKGDDLEYFSEQNPQLFNEKIVLPKGFKLVYGEEFKDEKYKNWACSVGFHPEQENEEGYNESRDTYSYNSRKKSIFFKDSFECMTMTDEGEICSYSFCYVNKTSRTAYIEPVCTREKFRRKGLGRVMLQGIVERCKNLGVTHCWVGSYGENRRKFYNSAGFVTKGAIGYWKCEI